MVGAIPDAVLQADRAHHTVLRTVAFSRHLNPLNAPEARRAFMRGAEAPPFAYQPLDQASELLAHLDQHEPDRAHPAGALVGRCFDGTRAFIMALKDRDEGAFDRLARSADWYPEPELMGLRFEERAEDQALDIPASQLIEALQQALDQRQLHDWRVEQDQVMAARVLVDGAKRLLRVNPSAHFRRRDLLRLVVHEIDVHAVRAANGQAQPLLCFQTGLPGSLATEEGLAMVSEEHAGVASPGVLNRQVEVLRAIDAARHAGFREVYESLAHRLGAGLAWGICLRIKRGLANPERPGVYAKDSVYLRGRMQVRAWLDAGGDVAQLYVGKVGLQDPVSQWLAQGWIAPGPVPPTWASAARLSPRGVARPLG